MPDGVGRIQSSLPLETREQRHERDIPRVTRAGRRGEREAAEDRFELLGEPGAESDPGGEPEAPPSSNRLDLTI